MKVLGMSLLSALIILAGNSLAKRKKQRIEILDLIVLMIKAIDSQIVYSHLAVPELLKFIAGSEEFESLSFVKRVNSLIGEGVDYNKAWKKATQEYIISYPVTDEDANMLIAFAKCLGSTDIEGQKSNCETYANLFKLKADGLRNKADSSAKIYNSLGVLTAALVFIILY